MTKEASIDVQAFLETDREPIKRSDLYAAMRQVMAHPARSSVGSEKHREPTREELSRDWKMSRR